MCLMVLSVYAVSVVFFTPHTLILRLNNAKFATSPRLCDFGPRI